MALCIGFMKMLGVDKYALGYSFLSPFVVDLAEKLKSHSPHFYYTLRKIIYVAHIVLNNVIYAVSP